MSTQKNGINKKRQTELNLKSLRIECFDLGDYGFIQNLSNELEKIGASLELEQ